MQISIRQGETLQVPIVSDDESAVSVRFQAAQDGVVYIDETAPFVDGEATILTNDTDHPIGDYEYMLSILYSDGVIEKLPDSNCDEECDLPILTICKDIE